MISILQLSFFISISIQFSVLSFTIFLFYFLCYTLVDAFVVFGIDYVSDDVGTCRPFYDIYNAFTITFCDNLLGPINSIWTSIGVAIFFMLPAMAIARCIILYYNKRNVNYCDPYKDDDSSVLRRSINTQDRSHNKGKRGQK